MDESTDIKQEVRDLAEKVGVVALKLRVVGTSLGEHPDPDRLFREGLEYILNDEVEALGILAEKLFKLSGGKGGLFVREAA
jgi:hypothetical protein